MVAPCPVHYWRDHLYKIPIGVDDFSKLVDQHNNFLFVDKTLMIKEFLEKGVDLSLIIRPRRWGKTLNMSMLRYFFAPEVRGRNTQGIFDHLNIAQEQDGAFLKYQGQHPVILISFKNIKQNSWELFFEKVAVLIANTYREHENVLWNSRQLSESQKIFYKRILEKEANQSELEDSLRFLAECLYSHYRKKVIILIDEYDTPLNVSYKESYFEQMAGFFKGIFGAALKGNDALEKGVMTGILRLSKNQMLSDLNNLKLYSLMDDQYSSFFGFSEEELIDLFQKSAVHVDMMEIRRWYNGYCSGHADSVYNPWSVLNCIDSKGELKPYWIKTGDETLLKQVLLESSNQVKEDIHRLLTGGTIESTIDEYLSFEQINHKNNESLWSLLWATGYLKTVGQPQPMGGRYKYSLQIPNYEVECSYRDVFQLFIRSLSDSYQYDAFLKDLVLGHVEAFVAELRDYLLTIPSWFDFPQESNYHTFLLGLTASLKETHDIFSNAEVGRGRPDMLLIPKDCNNHLGIILEFKRANPGQSFVEYEKRAAQGLEQIDVKKYSMKLKAVSHVKQILKLCLVFYGKDIAYKSHIE